MKQNNILISKKAISILLVVVCLVFLSGIILVIGIGRNNDDSILGKLDLGNQYMSELDYEQAIATYVAVLEIDPCCVDAYIGLAEAYMAKGDADEAIEVLQLGHSFTENSELRNRLESLTKPQESIETNKIDATEKAEEPSNEESLPSEDVEEEWDVRYEASIVDGIQRQGYSKYDLSDKEKNWLDEIIRMSIDALYVELLQYIKDEDISWTLVEKYTQDFNAVRIAYRGYKFQFWEHEYGTTVTLIPLDDISGYMYDITDASEDYSDRRYIVCECTNGMFDGEYKSKRFFKSDDGKYYGNTEQYGSVKNGLLVGETRSAEFSNIDGAIYENYYAVFFEEGKYSIVGTPLYEEGSMTFSYGYKTDPNWNRIETGETLEMICSIDTYENWIFALGDDWASGISSIYQSALPW